MLCFSFHILLFAFQIINIFQNQYFVYLCRDAVNLAVIEVNNTLRHIELVDSLTHFHIVRSLGPNEKRFLISTLTVHSQKPVQFTYLEWSPWDDLYWKFLLKE